MLQGFAVLDFIQENIRTAAGDVIMPFISMLGNFGIIWIVLGFFLLFIKKYRKAGFMVLIALLIEFLLCNVYLKNAVAAPRPFDINTSIELLIPKPHDHSFPSGHTGAAFAAVTAMFLEKVRGRYFVLVFACLMAFSRMYLYVHFPVDVIGGAAVGALSGLLAYACIYVFIKMRRKEKML